ncbi:type II toxin-antitoxin system HicB family antitoxin [Terracidiphilus gabretensis]|uniref:type II toxin-antitoxin system HicB family antitoxin n=1 Tax=Terracidiphilus gabretensis TaxID=1577687 RepID=UPI00071B944F|nr:type II toxin-antitoxin system HicB family antitoxin [Terracidiphilus gabretensis]
MHGYPVKLRKDGEFVLATFPDIPEAITHGKNRAEALEMAKEALEVSMDFYFEDQRPVPMPSQPKRGQAIVELPLSVMAKVLLLNEMLRQKVRPIELARRIGTTKQEVNRLTDLKHATKIDRIDVALRALGKKLVLDAA